MFIANIKSSYFILLGELSSPNWCFKHHLEQIHSTSKNSSNFFFVIRADYDCTWLLKAKPSSKNFNLKNGSIAGYRMLTACQNDIEKSPEERHISVVFKVRSSVLRKLIKQREKSIRWYRNVIRLKWKIMNAMWCTKVYRKLSFVVFFWAGQEAWKKRDFKYPSTRKHYW